jgi:hypothetical protein
MTAGSKKGERRGGRKKGTPNKATVERHLAILRASGVNDYSTRLGRDAPAKAMVELDALAEKYHPARSPEPNEELFVKYTMMYARVASNLTPYQSPALASIHTSVSKQSALERPGTVEREVYAEFMAEIAQSGELPRQVKAYLTNGGGSNGGGTGKIGGVANRNAD